MPLIIVFSLILIGSIFAITCIEAVFSKNLPKEIRGTMNGVQTFVGTIGSMWFTILGGYVFDIYGPKAPFILAGLSTMLFALFVSVVSLIGKFKH